MQAIPRKNNRYKVKDTFVAPEGYYIAEFDFSQAEVRVMAHYTRDPALLRIINDQLNMHDVVSEEQNLPRDVAKRLNFSAQYGIGAAAFSKKYGVLTGRQSQVPEDVPRWISRHAPLVQRLRPARSQKRVPAHVHRARTPFRR